MVTRRLSQRCSRPWQQGPHSAHTCLSVSGYDLVLFLLLPLTFLPFFLLLLLLLLLLLPLTLLLLFLLPF